MTVPIKTVGVAMAVSAAGFFSVAAIMSMDDKNEEEATVHCYGMNVCSGYTDYKTEENSCKGFVDMSAEECADAGGEVEAGGEAK